MSYFRATSHPWPILILLLPLLSAYEGGWRASEIGRELKLVRNVKPLWSRFGLALGVPLAGFDMDIQVNAPVRRGARRHWVTKFSNQTGAQESALYTPLRKGTYKFRARMENTNTTARGDFSPIAVVTVS